MKKTAISLLAGCAAMLGAALAQECTLAATPPIMPDPKAETADDRTATIEAIKAYQAALGEYRACLDAISANEELDIEARQQALNDFNATVEIETKMVEDWQKFDKKYQKANK